HAHMVFLLAIAVAAIAAGLDWQRGEIPNSLTMPAMGLAPLFHFFRCFLLGDTIPSAALEAAHSLGGGALCAVVPLFLFRQSAIGGGDVKLFIALGALLHPMLGVEAQTYGFFAGALLAPA